MKVCGIELKGNDAILVCLEGDANQYSLILMEKKKIPLKDSVNQLAVNVFASKINSFLEENEFDKVGIKARATKGRFAGGSVSFKMEALIQTADVNVEVIHGSTVKSKLKQKMNEVEKAEINSYQKEALMVALYLLN